MYLDTLEFVSDVPALLGFDNKEPLAGIVAQILYKTSRSFDSETFAPEGYYGWKPTEDFVVRTFKTNGTNFLQVYHFEELDDVSYGEESIFDRCITNNNNQTIEIGYGHAYPHKSSISVSAKWGWKAIPEDVKNAVAAKSRIRLSFVPLSKLGVDAEIGELELNELTKVWDNVVARYRELNRFAIG